MNTQPTAFWRLNYATDALLEQMISKSSVIATDSDFVLGLQIGEGILLARYDEHAAAGIVKAIGVVSGVDRSTSQPVVTWKRISETLYPSAQGQRFWRQAKPYFKFAKNVVQKYRLGEIFSKHLSNTRLSFESHGAASENVQAEKQDAAGAGGYVYVIKSQYGYKIGKTKRMKDRAQLFSVKLPFPIEVIHYAWFDDYSAAELHFHQMFKVKRMEGEWFRLSEIDLIEIKRYSGKC
jgi:hypothetical protein